MASFDSQICWIPAEEILDTVCSSSLVISNTARKVYRQLQDSPAFGIMAASMEHSIMLVT